MSKRTERPRAAAGQRAARLPAKSTVGKALKVPVRTVKPTTVRLEPDLQARLDWLQKILKRPANKLIGEAVEIFIEKRSAEIQSSLEGLLAQVKAYRRRDADFEDAIDGFVDAEARHARHDPAEGTVEGSPPDVGPAQALVRDLLGG